MKLKSIVLVLAAFAAAVVLVSCTGAGSGNERVYVYNWGDYIDPDLIPVFEKETGIKVVYETYDSNEAMYTKLKPGNTVYDLIFPSDYMTERMIKEDMLEQIDINNIPNIKHIDGRFIGLEFDPTGLYSVPYMWGTVGILYNTEMVDDVVDSWNILWDEKYKGQIFMYDSQRDTIAAALRLLGYSVNTRSIDELNHAKEILIAQKPLVQAYIRDEVKDKMIGGEGALAITYSGDAMFCMSENDALYYVVPKEGSNLWLDVAAIPKGAKNKSNAEKFIDFLCRPEIAAQNSEYIGYSTANKSALPLIDEEIMFEGIYWPDENELVNCEIFLDLGDFVVEYDKAWTEILVN